jgi:hypothetical protein
MNVINLSLFLFSPFFLYFFSLLNFNWNIFVHYNSSLIFVFYFYFYINPLVETLTEA